MTDEPNKMGERKRVFTATTLRTITFPVNGLPSGIYLSLDGQPLLGDCCLLPKGETPADAVRR